METIAVQYLLPQYFGMVDEVVSAVYLRVALVVI